MPKPMDSFSGLNYFQSFKNQTGGGVCGELAQKLRAPAALPEEVYKSPLTPAARDLTPSSI